MHFARRAGHAAVDLLYPSRCVACGRFGTFLCDGCDRRLEPATGPGRCRTCSARYDRDDSCPLCTSWKKLDRGIAAVEMDGPARQVVHALKYQGVRLLAPMMAARMATLPDLVAFDAATPIPLHRSRVRQRGFNQAELLLQALRWPRLDGALTRSRKTRTQVGLRGHERLRNVAGAFTYAGPELQRKRIALVDDVITTGATADECAAVLKDFGAQEVVVFAFARASHAPGRPPRDA